jgi:Fic family protein
MPDWDQNSPELRKNLQAVLRSIRDAAQEREPISLKTIRDWHRDTMKGLTVPNPAFVGKFRGQPRLETIVVKIGNHSGTAPEKVEEETNKFILRLLPIIARLDKSITPDADLTADQLEAVLEVIAWAHSEWVRIHPFANGNGRTARLLANAIALRYGLPPFIRLRPRPNHGYNQAADASMRGDHRPLVSAFRHMLNDVLSGN